MVRKNKFTILHIDDEVDFIDIMQTLCSFEGCDYHGYSNIEVALDVINDIQPDIVLLDLHFRTGFDGTMFLSTYKNKIKNLKHIPTIVVLSGLKTNECLEHAMDLGARECFSKYFNPDEFFKKLAEFASVHSSKTRNNKPCLPMNA